MIYQLILIGILINSWHSSNPAVKNIYFDVVHKTNLIGSLKVTKTIKGSKIYYQSATTIKTRIIKDIRVNYKYDVLFDTELLKRSDVEITLNEKSYAKTYTEWNNNNYQILQNGNKEKALKDSITYASIQLYFKEPVNISTCYSEQEGSFNTITALGNHTYKKVNSKGKESIYYYERGNLKKSIVDGGVISFKIIARNKR